MRRSAPILWIAGIAALVLLFALLRDRASPGPAPSPAPASHAEAAPERVAQLAPPVAESERSEASAPEVAPRASETAPGETLTVRVEGETGAPCAGALVVLVDSSAYTRALREAVTTHETPAGRALRANCAHATETDAHGEAVFAVGPGSHWIEARSADLFQFAVLNELPADRRITLRLEADNTAFVRVIDRNGAPLASVPVALRRRLSSGAEFDARFTESEAPDGCARFEHYQRRLRQGPGWHFALAFPVPGDPTEQPVPGGCAEAPVLRLPGAGSIVVHVRAPGGVRLDASDIVLALAVLDPMSDEELPLWPGGAWSRPPLDEHGDARVPWIGLGLRVRVELRRGDSVSARTVLSGPASDGERVECTLEPGSSLETGMPVVTGRFVLADGSAWPAAILKAWAILFPVPKDVPDTLDVAVQRDGRFRLPVRETLPPGGTRTYRVFGPHPGGLGDAVAFVKLDGDVPAAGLELGDVLLDHGPALAAGRAIDDLGRPVAQADLSLSAYVELEGENWTRVSISGRSITAADGSFALFLAVGERDPGDRLRLSANARDHAAEAPLEFVRGAQDLVLLLPRAGQIEGSLVLGDGLAAEGVQVIVRGAGFDFPHVEPDGRFVSRSRSPGAHSVSIRRRGADGRFGRAVATFEGVIVLPGETCRDPRLQGIEVSSPLHPLAITVVDRFGAPIPSARAKVIGRSDAGSFVAGADGVCRMHVAEIPADVAATAYGYGEALLRGVSSDARVTLDEGFAVRLRAHVPAGTDPRPFMMHAELTRLDPASAWRTVDYPFDLPLDQRMFDASGEFRLRVPAPGEYECSLGLTVIRPDHVGSGGRIAIDPALRFTVVAREGEQAFDIDVPADAIRRALEHALR